MPTYQDRKCKVCDRQIAHIDYKNLALVNEYTTKYNKIVPKYYSGACLKHQKQLTKAVKNARIMGLVPFTS